MLTSKDFFGQLQEEQEYLNCFMTSETYAGIPQDLQRQILVNTVRQKSSKFIEDEKHKELVRNVSKAKSELTKYEFEQNHKI